MMMTLQELLNESIDIGASDIHIVVPQRPIFRVNTELVESKFPEVTNETAAGAGEGDARRSPICPVSPPTRL